MSIHVIQAIKEDENGEPLVKPWKSNFGELYQYKVKLDTFHDWVDLNKKPDSEAPQVGDELYGDITTRTWENPESGEIVEFHGFKSSPKPDGYTQAKQTAEKIKSGTQPAEAKEQTSLPAGKVPGKQAAADKYLKDTSDVPRSLVIELLKYYDVQSLYNSPKYEQMIKLAQSLNDDIMLMIRGNRNAD